MAHKKKTTKEGITILLENHTVTKKYNKRVICMITFSNCADAVKEFNKMRQGHKVL